MTQNYSIPFGKEELIIKSGKLAGLSDGSVTAQWGDTVILATAVIAQKPREGVDFFPLSVEYEERLYAAGKISGSRFIKREGRPTERAILTARLVDRSIRPLFPKDFRLDVQIIITVLSYDLEHDPAIIAITAASAALMQTQAPFSGPIGASRVGYIAGELVINPTEPEMEKSEFDLIVSGSDKKVLMIEGGVEQVDEDTIAKAIQFGFEKYQPAIKLQSENNKEIARLAIKEEKSPIQDEIKKIIAPKLTKAIHQTEKQKREAAFIEIEEEVFTGLDDKYGLNDLQMALDDIIRKEVRNAILIDGIRPDGRAFDEIRPLEAEVAFIPRVHGSGLFSRGQTQVLTIATLGAPGDEQAIETMEEEGTKRYMHHYNFPPFSTGETRPLRGASRREIGHGALAERALIPVIPSRDDFPYTIRLVSEVLSSNGSSSMAATCGSTLALMDAGVPISAPVAGIAIGLVAGKDKSGKETHRVMTDIQGIEDFSCDMDFKITGTRKGLTAIQLDVKNDGLTEEIIKESLAHAKIARMKILDLIESVIPSPRAELSPYAPRIYKTTISPEKIGELIGPGGKNINGIIAQAGGKEIISIDIEDDGTVLVSSTDAKAAEIALSLINGMAREPKIGEIFTGPITQIIKDRIKGNEIGAVVQILPNQEGMIHISQLSEERVAKVTDVVKVGDTVTVKVMEIDKERGRISLSLKAAKAEANSQ
ncbi:MAG: polyribonucleotide nucleotidyltransferase [bacterium]|nr:polyribonucleotide nucleotidyltransferase [bacterium]